MNLDLNLSIQQSLAKKIRNTIEPDGARSKTLISEIELRKLVFKETNIHIQGMGDIVSILKTNYNLKTISRLLSKVKRSIVWDASMCGLPTKQFLELLTETETHIITSLSFFEIRNLCKTPIINPTQHDNAKYMSLSVLDDTASSKFIYVFIPKNNYVDKQLIEFCSQNNYHLYTRDLNFGLIARCFDFGVTIFNSPTRDKSPVDYTPNSEGKNFILSYDLLDNVSIHDVISIAENLAYNKMIITYDFVNRLESDKEKYIQFSLFLLYNEQTSIYLGPSESKKSLVELSEKYNAVVFTASITQALKHKQNYVDYKFITKNTTRNFVANYTKQHINVGTDSDDVSENLVSSESATTQQNDLQATEEETTQNIFTCKEETTQTENSKIALLETNVHTQLPTPLRTGKVRPYRLPLTEKIWVLDQNGKEIKSNKCIYLQKGFTVIYGKNRLNNHFDLEVYIVSSNTKYGNLIYNLTFNKNMVSTVDSNYKDYAEKLVLIT